jgi:hypothetical protein
MKGVRFTLHVFIIKIKELDIVHWSFSQLSLLMGITFEITISSIKGYMFEEKIKTSGIW